ncbi:MAG: DUF4837 family protein [Flavobacteriales bacterium]|nr:DUF4837 family protein [Flavobacteriales bacterium]
MKLTNVVGIVGIFTLLLSCSTEDSGFIPGYSGSFGEVVIVIENNTWKGDVGDSVMSKLNPELYGFPQEEHAFTMIQIPPDRFQSVLKTHRSIIVIETNSTKNTDGHGFNVLKNKWAKGQVLLQFNAENREDLFDLLNKNGADAVRILQSAETNRLVLKNKKFGDDQLNKSIESIAGFGITCQKDWEIQNTDSNSIWLRLERERPKGGYQHQISQGILISWTAYTDKLQFLDTNLFMSINRELKKTIPGPGLEQFMQMASDYMPPQSREINFKNSFGKEIRGLWRMEGNFMGGPFICYSFLDEEKQRIVQVYGYVYSPQFSKREYLREVEAIILSITPSEVNKGI